MDLLFNYSAPFTFNVDFRNLRFKYFLHKSSSVWNNYFWNLFPFNAYWRQTKFTRNITSHCSRRQANKIHKNYSDVTWYQEFYINKGTKNFKSYHKMAQNKFSKNLGIYFRKAPVAKTISSLSVRSKKISNIFRWLF